MKRFLLSPIGLILVLVLPGCFFSSANLRQSTLQTALVSQDYQFKFNGDLGWWNSAWADPVFEQGNGTLPKGVGVTADGHLVGTPQELGTFHFEVTAFEPQDFDNDGFIDEDSEWFTLFVTEPSTNEKCPFPDDSSIREIFLCTGTVEVSSILEDESFLLDMGYYINLEDADLYSVDGISFTLEYDPDSFYLDPEELNSKILREAATLAKSDVQIDDSTPGTLSIVMKARDGNYSRAGRLMDIPIHAAKNLASALYPFVLTIDGIASGKPAVSLPKTVSLDGFLVVD